MAFSVPLPENRRPRSVKWGTDRAGAAGPVRTGATRGARRDWELGGLELQGDQGAGVRQVGELADDAAWNDVEIVVAVVLALVGEVVVAHDHDVFGGVLPEHPARELAQPVRLEVFRDRRARAGRDVFPLDRHQRCVRSDRVAVQRLLPRLRPKSCRPDVGTRTGFFVTFAYRTRRYDSPPSCQRRWARRGRVIHFNADSVCLFAC